MNRLSLDLMWRRLIAATNEQAATLVRAAFSPIVREAGDLSACVFLPTGEMLAQARTGTPGHINSMANAMKHFISAYPPASLSPGDVLLTNDPHMTSGQLHDFTVMTPVFYRSRVVAFAGSLCHLSDVGGRGLGIEALSQFEEGIRIPISKLYVGGDLNLELLRVLHANVRTPNENVGDLLAQTAANAAAASAICEMLDEFEERDLTAVGAHIVEQSEAAMRTAIGQIPEGMYRGEAVSDGIDEPISLRCGISVADSAIHVDWAGSSPASRLGINVVLNYTHAYTSYALACLLSPGIQNNEGSLRPIRVTAPEGCILNARWPAPVAARHVVGHFLPMAIINAFSGLDRLQVLAEGAASIWLTQYNGYHSDDRPFSFVMHSTGGMGARATKDGLSATAFPSGVMGMPVEVVEESAPLLVLERSLLPDSGGAGRFRGGLGQRLRVRSLSKQPITVSVLLDRIRHPASGLAGGLAGAVGRAWIDPGARPVTKARQVLGSDEILVLELPGGGGFGDPGLRAPAAAMEDLVEGYVTAPRLREDYGLSLDGVTRLPVPVGREQ